MKKVNFYLVSEIAFVLMIILSLIIFSPEYKKPYKYALALATFTCASAFIIQLLKSATVVNRSNMTIKAKPESGSCDPVDVKPGETLCGIDGVKVNGRVYKTCDTTTIIVKEDGTVVTQSLTGKLINHLKDAGYIAEAPDDCWKPLFNS